MKTDRDEKIVVPDGYVTIAELAEMANCTTCTARNRVYAQAVPHMFIPRVNAAGKPLGARPLMVVERKAGMYAVIK